MIIMTCEVYLSTLPVGHSGSPSTVNETNCNKKKGWSDLLKNIMSSTNFWTCPTRNRLRKSTISCIALYCCGVIDSAIPSPDSRWRRFFFFWERETAARKSGRSRIGAFLPDLFNVRYHCFWYFLNSSLEGWYVCVILLCQLVHLNALLLGPANCELRITIDLVSEKTIVNSFVTFFLAVNYSAASLPRVVGFLVLFLFFSSTVPSSWGRSSWLRSAGKREHPVLIC